MSEMPDLARLLRIAEESSDVDDLGGSLRELCAYAARLEREAEAMRERLRAMEWDENTDVNQCAWCMGWKRYGHHNGCEFAALLAAERAGGGAA